MAHLRLYLKYSGTFTGCWSLINSLHIRLIYIINKIDHGKVSWRSYILRYVIIMFVYNQLSEQKSVLLDQFYAAINISNYWHQLISSKKCQFRSKENQNESTVIYVYQHTSVGDNNAISYVPVLQHRLSPAKSLSEEIRVRLFSGNMCLTQNFPLHLHPRF